MPNPWPTGSSFPQVPTHTSFSDPARMTAYHFQPDEGPVISRRISLSAPKTYLCKFHLTFAQKDIFWTWWEGTFASGGVEDGSLSFNFPHPYTGTNFEAKIVEAPVLTTQGGDLWELKCSILELYP